MDRIKEKQFLLTGFLEFLLIELVNIEKFNIEIITPSDPGQRGSHLTLKMKNSQRVLKELRKRGIIASILF